MAVLSKCDDIKVAGASVNSCSQFTSQLVLKGEVDTTADIQSNPSITNTATVTKS